MKSARVRPWQAGDAELLAGMAGLSGRTLAQRFHTGTPVVPASYLRSIERRWPLNWDAVVALVDTEVVGWAEFGWTIESIPRADVAICVADDHQRRGIGRELAAALLHRANTAGFTVLHADIQTSNRAAFALWASVTGSRRPTWEVPVLFSLGTPAPRPGGAGSRRPVTLGAPHGTLVRPRSSGDRAPDS